MKAKVHFCITIHYVPQSSVEFPELGSIYMGFKSAHHRLCCVIRNPSMDRILLIRLRQNNLSYVSHIYLNSIYSVVKLYHGTQSKNAWEANIPKTTYKTLPHKREKQSEIA